MSRLILSIQLLGMLCLGPIAWADAPTTAPAEPPLPSVVYGVLTEADGVTPVKGQSLNAVTANRGDRAVAVAGTDDSGHFIFPHSLKPGLWTIRMLGGGVLGSVDVKAETPVSVRLRLPTGSVNGTVFDPSGAPAAGVSVHLMDVKNIATYHAKTDENGGYHIEHVAAGPYQFGAFIKLDTDPPAYQRIDEETITIGEGALTKNVDLKLMPIRKPGTRPTKPGR